MANVSHVLKTFAAEPEKVDAWIAATGNSEIILEYKAIIATPEKTLQNIVASAKSALQLFSDPQIAKVTSCDTINFQQLRLRPTIIYLHNSISNMKYINTLNGIFFEQLYGHLLDRLPNDNENDLFIILEEASSIYIPVLPTAIPNTRKSRVSNIICIQGPEQLRTFYKDDAQNILANCVTKIFLPGHTDMSVLRELETLSGKFTFKDKDGKQTIKPLISADEIRVLPDNRSLILSGNKELIKGHTSPYFNSMKYRHYASFGARPLISDIPNRPIQLMS